MTPGPWTACPRTGGGWYVHASQKRLCNTFPHGGEEANARAIAAVPDLIEALKLALEHVERNPGPSASALRDTTEAVYAALRKAGAL